MRIEHINDVLPYVEGRSDFVVARKDGYVAIDYLFVAPDTFGHEIRRECRGLKFCSRTGAILARPLGKFFNIGEREETQPHLVDFSKPHWITSKLDGSMVHPMIVDGALILSTRMGRSQHAIMAERHLTPDLSAWMRDHINAGWTPIFEWIAPDNRIIIKYPESKLVLLAIRNTITGEYMKPSDVASRGEGAGVEVVDVHPSWSGTAHEFLDMVRVVLDAEGFVVRFEDGLWLKCKAEDYILKSAAKSSIELEKNALNVILSGGTDDIKPLLTVEQADAVTLYEQAVLDGAAATAATVRDLVASGAGLDQKTFAVEHLSGVDTVLRALAFQVRKGADPFEAVKTLIKKNTGSQADVDAIRHVFGSPNWPL